MQGPAWVNLFRRIPAELHSTLTLLLTTGAEVVLQSIVRLERDFLMVRGRMAGSMDAGRVVVVPYNQINYVGFNKKMTEVEAQNLLGQTQPQAGAAEAEAADADEATQVEDHGEENFLPAAAAPEAAAEPTPTPTPEAETSAEPTQDPSKMPGKISKSLLLARLRARLAKNDSARKDT